MQGEEVGVRRGVEMQGETKGRDPRRAHDHLLIEAAGEVVGRALRQRPLELALAQQPVQLAEPARRCPRREEEGARGGATVGSPSAHGVRQADGARTSATSEE